MKLIKPRKHDSHKGDHGKVLVIGGSEQYIGAPALAGLAALRTGVDLVVIAAPEKVAWAVNNYSPDLITYKIKGDFFNYDNLDEITKLAHKFDVFLIGNGIGIEPGTRDFVKEIIQNVNTPKVIDADAFKALKGIQIKNAILTPHKKEFSILTEEKLTDDLKTNAEIVKRHSKKDKIILLKSNIDIISDGELLQYNKTGNPGMTVGGTGDVLAGICLGLLAQSKDLFNSAYAAAYLSGKVGDLLLRQKGYGFTASDMLNHIAEIKHKTRWI